LKEYENMTTRYDTLALEFAQHRRIYPKVLQAVIRGAKVDASAKVLDVGCGTGNYIIALQDSTACRCWGVDPSKEMLSWARSRSKKIHFHQRAAEKLDFTPESFDLVFSVDVIHHLADPKMFYSKAWQVLKAGGRICTVTDSRRIIRHRLLSIYFPETIKPSLERYPPITQIKSAMREAGFVGITTETFESCYKLTDIQSYHDKAYSSLHLISQKAFQKGIERMERNLRKGPIHAVCRYLFVWGKKPAGQRTRG